MLCAVGDFAWDVVIRSDTALQHGGDTFGSVQLFPGGSAANVAVWAARCGADSAFVGKVGTDELGGLAHRNLDEEGVADHLIDSDDHPTGAVAVFVDDTGQRSMVSGHGADHYLRPDELPEDVIRAASHVHLTGWSFFLDPPRTAALRAGTIAVEGGADVSFDPSAFQLIEDMGVDAFLDLTTGIGASTVFPNRDEATTLTGQRDPETAARRLGEIYRGANVVLKLDGDGALVLMGDTVTHVPARPADTIDSTGAGDAFAGSYLAHLMRHGSPIEAATFACGVSAHVVAHVGARPALPDGGVGAVDR